MLGKDDSLHLFMLHLSAEFNMECLLAYIEFTQYQTFVLQNMELDIDEGLYHLVSLPNNLPISSIVAYSPIIEHSRAIEMEDQSEDYDLKIKARHLFAKYLCPGCEYECNISGRLRSKSVRMFKNRNELLLDKSITVKDMFLLFEDVKNELVRFLHPSFYAFKHTPNWQVVTELLREDSEASL